MSERKRVIRPSFDFDVEKTSQETEKLNADTERRKKHRYDFC